MSSEDKRILKIKPTLSLLWETAFICNEIMKRKGSESRVTVSDGKLVWVEDTDKKKKGKKK